MAEQLETTGGSVGPVVEIQFALAPADYVRAMRAFLLRDARVWIAMAMVVVIFAGGIANLVAVGELNLMGFFLLLFPWVLAAYLWWGWPASVGRRAQRDRRLRSPTTCQINDEQFVTQNVLGESCLEWEAFHRIIETRSYYLFVFALNRRTFVIVPRRAFSSAEEEAAFRDIVKRHLTR
jgi:hypothetical protein